MKNKKMHLLLLIITCISTIACGPKHDKKSIEKEKTDTIKTQRPNKNIAHSEEMLTSSSGDSFEKQIYLKIDKVFSGPSYINNNNQQVFYRLLEIPEEENLSIYLENINIGEEGGNYKLLERKRLTDDNSVLPKFGLSRVDSLTFIDSVTIVGYFNEERMKIDLKKGKRF